MDCYLPMLVASTCPLRLPPPVGEDFGTRSFADDFERSEPQGLWDEFAASFQSEGFNYLTKKLLRLLVVRNGWLDGVKIWRLR